MNSLFLAAKNGMNGNYWTIIIFVVLIVLMYFTMIKPQKKQQQKKMEMMNELKKGDNVILIDGLHGKIDSVNPKDKTIVVDADGIYLTFNRMAVQQILPSTSAASSPTEPTETSSNEEKPAENQDSESPTEKSTEEKPSSSDSESSDKPSKEE